MQHFSSRNFINQNFWFFWIVTHASACHYTVSYNILLSFLKPNVLRIVRMSVMMSNIWSQRECIESIKTILFCSFLNIINDTNFIDHYMNAAGLRGVFFWFLHHFITEGSSKKLIQINQELLIFGQTRLKRCLCLHYRIS